MPRAGGEKTQTMIRGTRPVQAIPHAVRHGALCAAAVLLGAVFPARGAPPSFEGQWIRTSSRLTVTVESWGDHCGTMPRSYSSSKQVPVDVMQTGEHLVFSTGRLRTDRCNSPNPALKTRTAKATGTRWSRVCETSKDNPKYERIEYTLDGSDPNRLVYTAVSKFNWTLQQDHCAVRWIEKRIYRRAAPLPTQQPKTPGASPILDVRPATDTGKAPQPRCTPGKAKRLILFPQRATVSPGQSLCFHARAVDAAGCRFPVAPRWKVLQNGVAVPGRMDAQGCFNAGENAAKAEGRYDVVATWRGVRSTTWIQVAYPDFGDLARARLDIPEELTRRHDAAAKNEPTTGALPASAVAAADAHRGVPAWVWGALGGGLLVLAAALGWWWRRLRAADPLAGKLQCPTCDRIYEGDARFCPHDASELVPAGTVLPRHSTPPPPGMICPRCHRGYEADARFCPHDASELIPYERWRRTRAQ